jgi:hypothetical protein
MSPKRKTSLMLRKSFKKQNEDLGQEFSVAIKEKLDKVNIKLD